MLGDLGESNESRGKIEELGIEPGTIPGSSHGVLGLILRYMYFVPVS